MKETREVKVRLPFPKPLVLYCSGRGESTYARLNLRMAEEKGRRGEESVGSLWAEGV
jgi:hypothetical protein